MCCRHTDCPERLSCAHLPLPSTWEGYSLACQGAHGLSGGPVLSCPHGVCRLAWKLGTEQVNEPVQGQMVGLLLGGSDLILEGVPREGCFVGVTADADVKLGCRQLWRGACVGRIPCLGSW